MPAPTTVAPPRQAPRPAPEPKPAPEPEPEPVAEPDDDCDPNYSGCVPITGDVDCAGGSGNGRAAGAASRRTEVTIAAGSRLPYDGGDWAGALLVVEHGEIELHCEHGGMRHFGTGAMLWFDGMGLRALHNPGAEPTVLVAIFRGAPCVPPRHR
ncbi:MAG: hypothetical protein LH603_05840 [Pseudonocardia sp.]|nr:hypothetical protein [Pseudonocardia sp.]